MNATELHTAEGVQHVDTLAYVCPDCHTHYAADQDCDWCWEVHVTRAAQAVTFEAAPEVRDEPIASAEQTLRWVVAVLIAVAAVVAISGWSFVAGHFGLLHF